jgi:hypothetical protein
MGLTQGEIRHQAVVVEVALLMVVQQVHLVVEAVLIQVLMVNH